MLETVIVVLIGAMVVAIVTTIFFLLHYIGYFYKVKVNAGASVIPQITFAYKFHEGQLSDCYQTLTEVSYLCPEKKTIVIHYDDPMKEKEVRSAVGVILTEGPDEKFDDAELEMKLKEFQYKSYNFPNVDYSVRSSHPYASSFSASFAAKKAYPALEEFIDHDKLCAHPYLEIYTQDTIHYMVPLSKQADFYVDEVKKR